MAAYTLYTMMEDVCLHTNNWFSIPNQPREITPETAEDIPGSFKRLVERILAFELDSNNKPTAITGESWAGTGYSKDLDATDWRHVFRRELATFTWPRFL